MTIKYAYLGSTEVSKEILQRAPINPELILSFSDEKQDEISGYTTYDGYDNWEQVQSINSERSRSLLRQVNPDIVLVMAWQELLEPKILAIPERGCVGRHLSMLPERRGRAPVAWALIHGLERTGVTVFWLDEGVDTGDIAGQKPVEIHPEDEAHDLHDKMTDATVELLNNLIPKFEAGEFPRTPQDDDEATYTHPRRPDMGLIDWSKPAARLHDFIRGQTHPYPGAFTYHKMDRIRVWHASVVDSDAVRGRPGEILSESAGNWYEIQTGTGVLDIQVENEGTSYPIKKGSVLGCHAEAIGR